MKNKLRAIIALALLCAFQNFSNANTAYVHDDAYNYLAYDCSRIIAFNNNYSDNIFTTPDIGFTFVDVDGEMSISKVIDDDFSLEMDLDVNSKKQIRPKARVIEGQKIDTKTPKFVEKVWDYYSKANKYEVCLINLFEPILGYTYDLAAIDDTAKEKFFKRIEAFAKVEDLETLIPLPGCFGTPRCVRMFKDADGYDVDEIESETEEETKENTEKTTETTDKNAASTDATGSSDTGGSSETDNK